jgi:hypothetical protein
MIGSALLRIADIKMHNLIKTILNWQKKFYAASAFRMM